MKKRLLSLVLALMMALGMFPATASAVEPPLTADELFVQEMETTYGVQVTWPRGIPPTEEEKGFIREGLEFWGKEFIQAMSAISRSSIGEPLKVILADNPPTGVWGVATANTLTLYITKDADGGIDQQWDTITFTHEFTHVVHNMVMKADSKPGKVCALFTELEACNGDRKYGQPWEEPTDIQYFPWAYGKTNVREDMATMIPLLLNNDTVAKINGGEFPHYKAKFNAIKKNLELTIGPTKAFDGVNGLVSTPVSPLPMYACIPQPVLPIKNGATHQIKVSHVLPIGANQNPGFTYSLQDPTDEQYVTVDENGLITAKKPTGAEAIYIKITPKETLI